MPYGGDSSLNRATVVRINEVERHVRAPVNGGRGRRTTAIVDAVDV
jgi:hypothetical protein